MVPAAGVQYDPVTQALIAGGAAPQIDVPAGWTATRTLSGRTEVGGNPMSLRGNDEIPLGQAVFGGAAADRLGIAQGDRVDIGGHDLLAAVAGAGQSVTVAIPVARDIVGDYGWWTVKAPAGQQNRRDLGKQLSAATGLASTADPSQIPDSDGDGLIYDTVGGTGPLSFEQKFSALFSGKVTSSTLGVISTIGLALGFVIAVSSFLAAVAERKREFGIMSSIGLADEVLYFFLVESALIFVTAYLVGVLGAGVAVALVVPGIATLAAWLQATGMVAVFIPAMAIVGALIPVHRLLQQRPVDLLGAR
ncbi:ABC transporter substrate-binding protein [Mycolicibacterium doricum]|uniref:ABC transporter substrate-binding protein n=1 Tax=Mycolicibacterium doricum TaxID=126673 RepID=A0A7I7VS21_9MYCO|nr:ABC transporter substrate-binding protein [Mycolicibacterium doricum]